MKKRRTDKDMAWQKLAGERKRTEHQPEQSKWHYELALRAANAGSCAGGAGQLAFLPRP
jgi:hypothetical protein